ncbi:DUF4389 domain-containing protein [bacterium]|nr:DUF4389 domain-containing protein [bacterium]MBU1957148.1 DUF4389 domain-containing protein [bacterium]
METEKQEVQNSKQPLRSRFFYMILFLIIGHFISAIVFLSTLFQFIYTWIFGKSQERVLEFTSNLSLFAKEIIDYLTFNSEEKPWPIGEWGKKE